MLARNIPLLADKYLLTVDDEWLYNSFVDDTSTEYITMFFRCSQDEQTLKLNIPYTATCTVKDGSIYIEDFTGVWPITIRVYTKAPSEDICQILMRN